jgi:Zn-finger protein
MKKGNKSVTALVIGDPHFKHTNLDVMAEFSKKTLAIAEKLKPTFVVILGDTLDTHEILRIEPKDAAEDWIYRMSTISKTFLLIGNHDMANPNEFLTKKHAFNSLKRWDAALKGKLFIVDEPMYVEIRDKSFVFCPYVPKNRFQEALDKVCADGNMWDMVDCIFAHQEFKGSRHFSHELTEGDEWDEDYPPVINGHIHTEQKIGQNIFIPGTPFQHSFGDDAEKRIWFLSFEDGEDVDEYYPGFKIDKIHLEMRTKKTLHLSISDISSFRKESLEHSDIKLKLKGTSEQITVFKSTEVYKMLYSLPGLHMDFINTDSEILNSLLQEEDGCVASSEEKKEDTAYIPVACRDQVSYLSILQKVVSQKPESVQEMYKELVGVVEEEVIYEIVIDTDEEEE